MYEARIAVLACVFRAIMSPHGVTKAGSRHDPIYKQCSIQRVFSQLSSSAFGEEPWRPMEKHASDAETSAHCTITGQARTPSASTGSRAHAGKMLNGSAPFSAVRPVALHAWTALSDAERRWYRQCRGRSVLVTSHQCAMACAKWPVLRSPPRALGPAFN